MQEPSPVSLYDDSLCLPAPIHDYIESVASALSPLEDIRVNVPEIAIPQQPVSAAGQVPAQPSGGFGPVDAAGHNAYECYASPLVTARRVEATVLQNTPPVAFGAWLPLPANMTPDNGVPNENLVGYVPNIERLHNDAMRIFDGVQLPNHVRMVGRLKHSQVLTIRVSNV